MTEKEIRDALKEIADMLDKVNDYIRQAKEVYEDLAQAQMELTDLVLNIQIYSIDGGDNAND